MLIDLFDEPAQWRAQVITDFRLREAERCAAASPVPGFPQLLDSLMFALDDVAAGPWLDVGGGLGGTASWIERSSERSSRRRVVVVDPSTGSLTAARRLFPSLGVAAGAGEHLPIATGSIQVVIVAGVVSLLDDADAVLTEVRRVLAVGGRVAITDIWSATTETFTSGPNTFRSLEDFTAVAERCGFQQVHLGVAELSTGWWPTAAQQVTDEILVRYAGSDGFDEWRADLEHLDSVFESGRVIPAGVVLESGDHRPDHRERPALADA